MGCSERLQTEDDVYCLALAKALYYVSTPVTVGFYAPWGRYENSLLEKVEAHLHAETSRKNDKEQKNGEKPRNESAWNAIYLILCMVFYCPLLTDRQRKRKNVKNIVIHYSAWEYAASDQLWAALVTTLCDGIESYFGILPMSIYRVVGKQSESSPNNKEWVSKKILCLPLWLVTILVIVLAVSVGVLLLVVGFPTGGLLGDAIAIFEGAGVLVAGVSAAHVIQLVLTVMKNMFITQKREVERKMNRSDVSAQLGFMNAVKREVMVITSFIELMAIFQRQRIRVVLEITNLDKCTPDKVVGVLNAMNILLSDPNAPFISILALDPRIIVDGIECYKSRKAMVSNGYEFLNRIVTLPFSVPKMDCETKLHVLRTCIHYIEELVKVPGEGEVRFNVHAARAPIMQSMSPYISANQNELTEIVDDSNEPLIGTSPEGPGRLNTSAGKRHKANTLIQEALDYLFEDSVKEYITDNVIHIRRIVNTLMITIQLMVRKVRKDTVDPKKAADWVLLANQWPCRLSWILQCIEDEQQKSQVKPGSEEAGDASYEDKLLWKVFDESLKELDMMNVHIENLLALDGDPELFHKFLQSGLKVKDANFYLPFTVNLDFSLKRQMELLRGSRNLREIKKSDRLTTLSVLNMTVDDVCEEMDNLQLIKENLHVYKKKLRKHNLNGRALICSDNCEIKEALGMGLGDWTNFSMHFLGVVPQGTPPASAISSVPFYGMQEKPKSRAGSRENILKGSILSLTSEDLGKE